MTSTKTTGKSYPVGFTAIDAIKHLKKYLSYYLNCNTAASAYSKSIINGKYTSCPKDPSAYFE